MKVPELNSASSKTSKKNSNIVGIGHTGQNMWSNWTIKLIMLIMLIVQIAHHMQISIRQFLYTGDPYFTFLQKNFGVLNISGFTMGLYQPDDVILIILVRI